MSENLPSFARHVRVAALSGIGLGLGLGHVDLAVRLWAQRIEWFEVHLSLLMPVCFAVVLSLIIATLLHLGFRVLGKGPNGETLEAAYSGFAISLPLLAALFPITHFALYGDLLLWEGDRVNTNAAIFLVTILLLVGFRAKFGSRFSALRESRGAEIMKTVAGNYAFFLLFAAVFSLGYDLYSLRTLPETGVPTSREKGVERPNLLIITLDTVRSQNVSFLGYNKPTMPQLGQLAERSVVFEEASSVTSWTLPAHASLFTGQYSFHHKAHEVHQKLDEDRLTLAEILSAQGYRTAGFIGGPYCKAKYGIGQGFHVYHDRLDFFEYRHTYDPMSVKRGLDFLSNDLRFALLQNDGERLAPEINRDVFRWFDRISTEENFFLFINYFDAHDPYDQGREYRKLFTDQQRDDEALNQMVRSYYFDPVQRYQIRSVDPATREYLIAMYDAEIHFLDKHVALLLAEMQRRGFLENTLVVITSDHGEEFFEHGGVMHKQTLYEEVLRVPLMFYFPSKLDPGRISGRVSLVDVLPTVLELLNIPVPENVDGKSLLDLMQGNTAKSPHEYVVAQRYARKEHGESYLASLTGERMKFIHVDPPQPRMPRSLFDLEADPWERENLINEKPDLARSLERDMQRIIKK